MTALPRLFLVFFCATSVFAGAPAAAHSQPGATPQTGSLITRRPAQINGESVKDARLTTKRFGECTVLQNTVAALQFVNTPVTDPAFKKMMPRVFTSDCLSSGELTIPGPVARGAIFEALYLKEFGRAPLSNFATLPSFDYTTGYAQPFSEEASTAIGLAILGDCVTRTLPGDSHKLMTSMPGSALENEAMGKIVKVLATCVPPNKTIAFSRSIVRSSIAEAIYRLSSVGRKSATQ